MKPREPIAPPKPPMNETKTRTDLEAVEAQLRSAGSGDQTFRNLPVSVRQRVVDHVGRQMTQRLGAAPSRDEWDECRPAWMPQAVSVEKLYVKPRGLTWWEARSQ